MSTTGAGKPEAPGAVTPQKKIELFSGTYFAACTLGGIIGTSRVPTYVLTPTYPLLTTPSQPAAQPTPPSHLSIS